MCSIPFSFLQGFCQVLKKLEGVTPQIGWKEKPTQSKIDLPELESLLPGIV